MVKEMLRLVRLISKLGRNKGSAHHWCQGSCNVMRKGTAFVWLSGVALAAFLAFGGGDERALRAPQAVGSASVADSLQILVPQGVSSLHWPSVTAGVILGFILTILAQVSWHDLPQRTVRWLIANERNFYRLGLATACVGVLLFY